MHYNSQQLKKADQWNKCHNLKNSNQMTNFCTIKTTELIEKLMWLKTIAQITGK
jgi:hypothetical protein